MAISFSKIFFMLLTHYLKVSIKKQKAPSPPKDGTCTNREANCSINSLLGGDSGGRDFSFFISSLFIYSIIYRIVLTKAKSYGQILTTENK